AGEIGRHIAEGDAIGKGGWIAVGEKTVGGEDRLRQSYAITRTRCSQEIREGGVQSGRAKETCQRRRDPGHSRRIESARRATSCWGERANTQRAQGRGARARVSQRCLPICQQELRLHRVHVDRPIQMTATVEVVFQTECEVMSQVTLE